MAPLYCVYVCDVVMLQLQLYNKTCEVAKAIAAMEADLYIIHTPHGISLSDAYGVYGNTHAAGNGLWLGQWSEFQVWNSIVYHHAHKWRAEAHNSRWYFCADMHKVMNKYHASQF